MPKQNKSTRSKKTKDPNSQKQNIGIGDQAVVGGDVTGRDKLTAGGHVIQAGVGATVVVTGEQSAFISALHQLPAPPADFTGRETELKELREAIEQGGVIISGVRMHGLGGAGKTALALKLASELKAQYRDAQFYLDLQGVSERPLSPAEALSRIIHAFQPEAKLPESLDELRSIYLSLLEGRRALLLMDNAKDAAQVAPLLPPAACLLLVTSRRQFHLPGLHAQSLDALKPEEARELLVRLAPRVDAPLTPTLSPKGRGGTTVEVIARLCGYLPFALRAAGSLLAVSEDLDPAEFAEQLQDEQARLKLANATAQGSEITLEASFNLSYAALDPETARVFRGLAVFPGDFDAAAEEAIAEDKGHEHLSELVRRSLAQYNKEAKRYWLHDLTRAFAEVHVPEGGYTLMKLRHSEYYKSLLHFANKLYEMGGDSILEGLALFDLEKANIEAGQEWAVRCSEKYYEATQLCSNYCDAWNILDLRLHLLVCLQWLEAALVAARRLEQRKMEGVHLCNIGIIHAELGELRKAIEFYQQSLIITQEIGDLRGEGHALTNIGISYRRLGELSTAIKYYERHLEILRQIADRRSEGNVLGNLGNVYLLLGETYKAIEYYGRQLTIVHDIGDRRGEGYALMNTGNAHYVLNQPLKAEQFHRQALHIFRELGDRRGESSAQGNLGDAYADLDRLPEALDCFEQAFAIARESSDRLGEGNALFNMSFALDKLGERKKAIAHAEAALKIYEEIESPDAERVRKQLEEWRESG